LIRSGSTTFSAKDALATASVLAVLIFLAAPGNKKTKISQQHIMLAIRKDEELNQILAEITIGSTGVVLYIHRVFRGIDKSKKEE
jgi:hypothetical protein